jgi:hypothetical protein
MDAPSLNIVELIENNPITKLSSSYNGKLLTKIQEGFTDFEQQLFVSSFYCYFNCDQKNDYAIDLDNVWEWLGFTKKSSAKRVLEQHFVIDADYIMLMASSESKGEQVSELIDASFPEASSSKKGHGGHNIKKYMLSVKTFKSMCLKAGTEKANEIHEYYLKMEEIIHKVVQDESDELKLQLESAKMELDKKNNEINQIVETNKNEIHGKVAREREKMLLHEFGMSGALIYLIKVKTNEDKSYIIKIGESRKGVRDRYNEHKTKYGDDILLLDCYAVKRSKEMESFILHHDKIRPSQVSNLPGHEKELELFLIGKSLSYNTVTQLIKNNMKQFNEFSTEKLEEEIKILRDIITNSHKSATAEKEDIIQELLNNQKIMMKMIQNLENQINKTESQVQIKTATVFQEPLVTLGPRLQKINPDTLTLNKVYESVAECLKESNFVLKRPSIVKAVTENTVYHGYRWFFVDRDEDATKINNLQPTKATRPQNMGYIAKLNATKTEILNVYIDRKTAATNNNFASHSSLDNPVKNESLANGHYYILYDNCDADLISKYEHEKGEPLLYKDGVGQFDAQGKMIKEYVCKYDCIKQMKMSDKSLAKVLDTPNLYNGFCFRRIGSKVSV